MENPSPDSVPPELQVWVDTELTFEGTGAPAEHQKIESALGHLPGVASLTFVKERVAIRHDPLRITGAELRERMAQAGFKVSEAETASSDPVSDLGEEGGAAGTAEK
jgi:hypothetical protein